MGETKRNGTIDFFRFVFAVLIVLTHFGSSLSFSHSGIGWIKTSATIGVEFFFIVTGYLLAKPPKDHTSGVGKATADQILRKLSVIYPVYLFSYVISVIFKAVLCGNNAFKLISNSIYELLLLQILGLSPLANNQEYIVGGSWYLSAMMIAVLLIYPLLYANRKLFINVISPILAFGLLACMATFYGKTALTSSFAGLIRAVALMCVGCMLNGACESVQKINVTKLTAVLLTIVELGCYLFVVVATWFISRGMWDFALILLLAVAIGISFSGKSLSGHIFHGKACLFLGKWSLAIYLNHVLWIKVLIARNMPLELWQELLLVGVLTLTSSLFSLALTDGLKFWWRSESGKKFRALFVKT